MRESSFNVFVLDEAESAALMAHMSGHDRAKGSAYFAPGSMPSRILEAEEAAMRESGFHDEAEG